MAVLLDGDDGMIGYSFLASFSPSVVRASVMIVLICMRRYSMWYDLGSGFLCECLLFMILLKNPMQLFHTGLQMSFLAVLTLSAAAPFFRKFYQGIFLSSGVVWRLGLLPYAACVFNYVSLAAVFINVPDHFPGGVSGGSAWDRRICPEPDLAGTDCGINRNHGTGYRRIVWIADKLQQYDLYQRCHII